MRKRHATARQFESERATGGTATAAIQLHRTDPLSLPRLSPLITPHRDTALEVEMALNWLDAGYLDNSMAKLPAKVLIQSAFKRWVDRWARNLENLSPLDIGYTVNDSDNHEGDWTSILDCDSPNEVRLMEPRYLEISRKAPGLYETALYHLEMTVCRVSNPGTPMGIMEMASDILWLGATDEEEFREVMLEGYGMDPEELGERCTPAVFRNGLPEWLLRPKKGLNQRKLQELVKSEDEEIAALAKSALALARIGKKVPMFEPSDYMTIYPLSLMRWNTNDQVLRCFDDIINEANYCGDGYTTYIIEERVARTPEAFQRWLSDMKVVLTVLGHANTLIGLMSIPDAST